MSSDFDNITQARRAAIEQTIHIVSTDDVKILGEALFPFTDHPWRDRFFTFVAEPNASPFYHAVTEDAFHILYSPSKHKGMWFQFGAGMGPIQEQSLVILKEIVQSRG